MKKILKPVELRINVCCDLLMWPVKIRKAENFVEELKLV
jgi:hypothetical protein